MSNIVKNKPNYNSIDLVKFIASLFVVIIHASPLVSFSEQLNNAFKSTIPRLAVPLFFACSGYFFFKGLKYKNNKIENCKENRAKLFKYTRRIALLYIIWSGIYLLWLIPEWHYAGWLSFNAFIDYAISFFRKGSYYHLWYILELFYATIIGYIILSLFNKKSILFISSILYILGMFTYSYSWISCPPVDLLNKISEITGALWESATRAFPLMMFGFITANSKRKISVKISSVLFIVSFIGLLIEYYLINNYTTNHEFFSYIIFTIPCEVFLFLSVISVDIKGNEQNYRILRNSSTIIYCIHPMIMNLLGLIPFFLDLHSLVKYFIIAGLSVLSALALVKLSNVKAFKLIKYLY